MDQHLVNVVFAGSVDKCFAPKRDNKFRLIRSLYCPQEPFNNINIMDIDTISTFMAMLLEGRHLQFFVHKKLDPSSYLVMSLLYRDGDILLYFSPLICLSDQFCVCQLSLSILQAVKHETLTLCLCVLSVYPAGDQTRR